jgi:hypothetical protein
LLGRELGYIPVLAELALHVATHRGDGKGLASGMKMVKGFLLNGIDVQCAWFGMDEGVIGSGLVFPYAAITPFPVRYDAFFGT